MASKEIKLSKHKENAPESFKSKVEIQSNQKNKQKYLLATDRKCLSLADSSFNIEQEEYSTRSSEDYIVINIA